MGDGQKQADELEDRLILFGVRIIKVADALPGTPAGRHIAGQILRSGTSPAPNYAEARGAESHADFVHKRKIVVKELNETHVWLRMIALAGLMKADLLGELINENKQLCKIINASLTTAKSRHPRNDK